MESFIALIKARNIVITKKLVVGLILLGVLNYMKLKHKAETLQLFYNEHHSQRDVKALSHLQFKPSFFLLNGNF